MACVYGQLIRGGPKGGLPMPAKSSEDLWASAGVGHRPAGYSGRSLEG
jgi:hypothetical protein